MRSPYGLSCRDKSLFLRNSCPMCKEFVAVRFNPWSLNPTMSYGLVNPVKTDFKNIGQKLYLSILDRVWRPPFSISTRKLQPTPNHHHFFIFGQISSFDLYLFVLTGFGIIKNFKKDLWEKYRRGPAPRSQDGWNFFPRCPISYTELYIQCQTIYSFILFYWIIRQHYLGLKYLPEFVDELFGFSNLSKNNYYKINLNTIYGSQFRRNFA